MNKYRRKLRNRRKLTVGYEHAQMRGKAGRTRVCLGDAVLTFPLQLRYAKYAKKSLGYISRPGLIMKSQSTALNGSDPPCSNPASTAVRTAAKYSFSLRPFSPANSVNNMYRESATTFAKSRACRTLLNKGKEKKTMVGHEDARVRGKRRTHSGMCVREETRSPCRRSISSGMNICRIRPSSRPRRSAKKHCSKVSHQKKRKN
jgi:hypothetical protein